MRTTFSSVAWLAVAAPDVSRSEQEFTATTRAGRSVAGPMVKSDCDAPLRVFVWKFAGTPEMADAVARLEGSALQYAEQHAAESGPRLSLRRLPASSFGTDGACGRSVRRSSDTCWTTWQRTHIASLTAQRVGAG